MKPRFLPLALLSIGLTLVVAADEPAKETAPPKQATKEEIQARLAEHMRKKEAKAAADRAAEAKADDQSKADAVATAAPVAKDSAAKTPPPANAKAAPEAAQVLPKVDVRKSRVTELDLQLGKQNQEIAREKTATKPTKLDEALNGEKISSALAIFGGQSSDDRANVSKERVAMMEDEKDIIEAISQAQTKEEKADLEKLLADMKATRRELEKSLK